MADCNNRGHCIPFRCKQVDFQFQGGRVLGTGIGAVGETALFVCNNEKELVDIGKSVEVTCTKDSNRHIPVIFMLLTLNRCNDLKRS